MNHFAFAITSLAGTICFACLVDTAFAQTAPEGVPLSAEEVVAFVKGKRLTATRIAGGEPSLQFKEDGSLYGMNSGQSDSGKWRVEDGKLCMTWRRWDYDGCGLLMRVGNEVRHLHPDQGSVHLVFKP